ncbi:MULTISPECIES: MotA/TolQ/ExbB proton channel family protein [unclassified Thalassotalea]|uniref:MotA/TolQ/ExbB proton channel family protein n=1 Tax=unclassified Thalassotalea TaxID=2614972 RepID=UPI00108102CF|nr:MULTISPECIES: MotA/TolQ/ExbB proton channel family protein [unclassified Thalassotalea]NMP16538.1 MotA/TolQ/ExbB proton channel family protein [Thalassotalea sp. Y01]QBY03105.1 MotA/TolQ/ExbB proton channel family protein [Thalassotalea sp. HSM 43]
MFDTIIRFFQEGGSFMFPIAVVLAIGLAIALERAIYLMKMSIQNGSAMNKITPMLQNLDFDGIEKVNDGAAITSIFKAGITRMKQTPRREEIEYAMEEGVMETLPRLEKRTAYLATLANIATLLGLLGTIIGLIAAFSAVASADPSQKASLLSDSISVAMNTTAFGLISAIPLLLCHSVLQTKTTEIVDNLEMAGVKFLNIISKNHTVASKSRATD